MSRAKQSFKRKRQYKAVPVLGAAGLSLTLASGASLANPAPSLDTMTHNTGESREIVLHEEEIFDFSLATFHVFDKEKVGPLPAARRLIVFGGGACCQFACLGGQGDSGFQGTAPPGNAASPPQPRPTRPWHKNIRKRS
jgi:hypothetical protein